MHNIELQGIPMLRVLRSRQHEVVQRWTGCTQRRVYAQISNSPKAKPLPYSSRLREGRRKRPGYTEDATIEASHLDRIRASTLTYFANAWSRRYQILTHTFLWALNSFLIAHLIWTNIASINNCHGPSMLPTLNMSGDWVLISRLHSAGRGIKIGDLISYDHPVRQGTSAIKRVVAMPGDFVCRDTPGKGEAMLQVPKNHVWIAGDNLPWTRDSRHFGALPMGLIRGRVVARVLPFSERRWFSGGLEGYVDHDRT